MLSFILKNKTKGPTIKTKTFIWALQVQQNQEVSGTFQILIINQLKPLASWLILWVRSKIFILHFLDWNQFNPSLVFGFPMVAGEAKNEIVKIEKTPMVAGQAKNVKKKVFF